MLKLYVAIVALLIAFQFIVFGLHFIWYLFQVAIHAAPAWLTGGGAGYAAFHFYRHNRIKELLSSTSLSKLVTVSFDGRKLAYAISEPELARHSSAAIAITLAALIYVATSGAILWVLSTTTAFDGLIFLETPISNSASSTWAGIFSLMLFIVAIVSAKATSRIKTEITQNINCLLIQANLSLKGIDELQAILREIVTLAQTMRVNFSEDPMPSIRSYVDANKADILRSTGRLESLVALKIVVAKANLTQLGHASNDLNQVMQRYSRAASAVSRTGNASMFYLLDQYLIGIENSKTFLSKKEWQGFHKFIDWTADQLDVLLRNASNYSDDRAIPDAADHTDGTMNPYKALHVPENITEDQLIGFWKRIRSVYHPDKGIVNEDEDRHYTKVTEAVMGIVKLRGFAACKFGE